MASLVLHPVPQLATGAVDTRYYTMLADTVPPELASPAVLLDCMLLHVEQRVAHDQAAEEREVALAQAEAGSVEPELPRSSAGKKKGKAPRPPSAASTTASGPCDDPVPLSDAVVEAMIAQEFEHLLSPAAPDTADEGIVEEATGKTYLIETPSETKI